LTKLPAKDNAAALQKTMRSGRDADVRGVFMTVPVETLTSSYLVFALPRARFLSVSPD
jgi:hypothetical protein